MRFWHILNIVLIHKSMEAIKHTEVHAFIPGVYKREASEADPTRTDIISIKRLSSLADVYETECLAGLRNSEAGPDEPMFRSGKWIAVYLAGTKQLMNGTTDATLTFVPEQGLLYFGSRAFFKMDNR